MKVLVLGAGIAGVTTAYELAQAGHEVTVIEREAEPAAFTSYANAGLFAPGHSYAWSSPAAPGILLRSLWRNDQALRFRPNPDPAFWSWMWQFWNECTAECAERNTARKVRLCTYSQSVFHETLAATGVEYDGRKGGLLYFYRSPKAFEAAVAKSRILSDNGCDVTALDRDGVVAADPALAPVKERIAGAIYGRADESGDCRKFARGLAGWLQDKGVAFKFSSAVTGFEMRGERIEAVVTDQGPVSADAYVLCLGVYSPQLARQLGVKLPIYPVKGYSVTLPVGANHTPPAIGGVDEENLVAYCPLGDRLRITATAEFSGYGRGHSPKDFRHMMQVMRTMFPDGADYEQPDYWAGLRPMTPTGAPILGQGRHANLWFNTGLGHMGWTMSHGAARITADLIAGQAPAIALDGMTVTN
jgi:D-amino-acid dehydrogenase